MRFQRGTTMIEILITLLVATIGLLGLAGMQLVNLKNVNNSQYRTQATILAYSMAERMRSNKTGVNNGSYNSLDTVNAASTKPDCMTKSCSTTEATALDLYEWNESIQQDAERGGLPASAKGTVTVDPLDSNIYHIAIIWKEQTRNAAGGVVADKNLTLSVRI